MSIIAVSAGHHHWSPGARYKTEFVEHTEAIIWACQIVAHMHGRAKLVPFGCLKDKTRFINGLDNISLAMEVHFNSAKQYELDEAGNMVVDYINGAGKPVYKFRHVGNGSETLYCPGSEAGLPFANIVQEVLANNFQPSRGIKPGYYQMDPKRGPDYFLKRTKCPAIIIEPDFVQNYKHIQEMREQTCMDIAHKLLEVLG